MVKESGGWKKFKSTLGILGPLLAAQPTTPALAQNPTPTIEQTQPLDKEAAEKLWREYKEMYDALKKKLEGRHAEFKKILGDADTDKAGFAEDHLYELERLEKLRWKTIPIGALITQSFRNIVTDTGEFESQLTSREGAHLVGDEHDNQALREKSIIAFLAEKRSVSFQNWAKSLTKKMAALLDPKHTDLFEAWFLDGQRGQLERMKGAEMRQDK